MVGVFLQECESCGDPILPNQPARGQRHRKCFDRSHICGNCDEEILPGQKYAPTKDGMAYHKKCLVFAPANFCGHCHLFIPIAELKKVGDEEYHNSCYQKVFFCAKCRKPVTPENRYFDRNGLAHHRKRECIAEGKPARDNLCRIKEVNGKLARCSRDLRDKRLWKRPLVWEKRHPSPEEKTADASPQNPFTWNPL